MFVFQPPQSSKKQKTTPAAKTKASQQANLNSPKKGATSTAPVSESLSFIFLEFCDRIVGMQTFLKTIVVDFVSWAASL